MSYTSDKKWFNMENFQPALFASVKPDGWDAPGMLTSCDWDQADFRLQSARYTDVAHAVNVELSERSQVVYVNGMSYKVRVKITFVGDCEPDQVVHGFMTLVF